MTGEGLLKRMFPPPAPEQILLQVLVPDSKVDAVMEAAIGAGHLDRVGSGAVFTINCNDAWFSQSFPGSHSNDEGDSSPVGSGELEAICCICEKGIADDIAQAALQGGAPGPTITFGEGGGVRDKIPLLRITKGPEKEFVWCVVEKADADDIFGGMARAGKITEPGRGSVLIPVRLDYQCFQYRFFRLWSQHEQIISVSTTSRVARTGEPPLIQARAGP